MYVHANVEILDSITHSHRITHSLIHSHTHTLTYNHTFTHLLTHSHICTFTRTLNFSHTHIHSHTQAGLRIPCSDKFSTYLTSSWNTATQVCICTGLCVHGSCRCVYTRLVSLTYTHSLTHSLPHSLTHSVAFSHSLIDSLSLSYNQ
jgi:hypothetical protein